MTSLPELWKSLRETTSGSDGEFRLRLCHSTIDLRLFAAVSGTEKHAAIVVEVAAELLPAQLRNVSGARLLITAAELPGLDTGRGAVIVCLKDAQFEDLFEQLGNCLIDSILNSSNSAEAVQVIIRQIERWRRFLERRREILSHEEVRGLIGELGILERLIFRIGYGQAFSSWKSPHGSIRDFECPDISIEAKTFIASTGAAVRINDPLQLEPDPGIPLILACLELSRTVQPGHRLPDHVARIFRFLGSDRNAIEQFENLLALSGYLPSHDEMYSDGYIVGATHAFRVSEQFPRIRAADVPAHVQCVQFSLEVLPLIRASVSADNIIGPVHQE